MNLILVKQYSKPPRFLIRFPIISCSPCSHGACTTRLEARDLEICSPKYLLSKWVAAHLPGNWEGRIWGVATNQSRISNGKPTVQSQLCDSGTKESNYIVTNSESEHMDSANEMQTGNHLTSCIWRELFCANPAQRKTRMKDPHFCILAVTLNDVKQDHGAAVASSPKRLSK